jgi:hypothetical protein
MNLHLFTKTLTQTPTHKTGSAASAYSSEEAALDSAFPPLTGSAAIARSAAFAAFDSQDNYYATVGPLTGSALAAESAFVQSEDSFYATVFPPLTGSAAAAESVAFASQDSVYATAFPPMTAAAPIATGTAASAPLKDACGPAIPDPTVPDSCDTPVEPVSAPAAWGVQCLNDTGSSAPINITACAPLIGTLCSNQWQNLGKWTWLTAPGCALGSFLPPKAFEGSAPGPKRDACENLIYASMVDGCQYAGAPWNLAGVNVKVFPSDGPAGTSGEAVNVGYGSYVVAGRQLRLVSDDKDCTYVPRDDYCRGPGCFPPSYYRTRFAKPTPCAVLGSLAATFVPLGG